MNFQERKQLNLFLEQLVQVQAGQKDAEAETLIREACGRQPDAGYLLVQRAMQLEHALESTKAQCSQLQAELDKATSGSQSNFLNNANAWGSSAVASTAASTSPAATPGSRFQPRAQGTAPAPAAPAASAWGSGMLGTVATTAAGVVAGGLLYHGVSNLMNSHDKSANATSPSGVNKAASNYDGEGMGTDETLASTDMAHDLGGDDLA